MSIMRYKIAANKVVGLRDKCVVQRRRRPTTLLAAILYRTRVFLMPTPQFPPADADARAELIEWIRSAPLVYGPWQTFKRLYKDAETAFANGTREPEVLAALLARFDAQSLDQVKGDAAVAGRFDLMHFRDGYAYVLSEGEGALQTFDLSAPMQPKIVASVPIDLNVYGYGNEFRFVAGHLWLQSGPHLWAFDLAAPARPRLVGQFDTKSQFTLFAGESIVFYAGGNNAAFRVMQLRDENLVEVGDCEVVFAQGKQLRQSDDGRSERGLAALLQLRQSRLPAFRADHRFFRCDQPARDRRDADRRAQRQRGLHRSGRIRFVHWQQQIASVRSVRPAEAARTEQNQRRGRA